MWVPGIDVSHHQGDVDWSKVAAAGIRFAWLKATEATTVRDDKFTANRDGCEANGIAWGAYHFIRPGDGRAQAEWFVSVAGKPGGIPHALDLEVANVGTDQALSFLRRVEELTGVRPVYYGNSSYISGTELATYDLWLPRYTAGNTVDPNPTGIKQAPAPPPWSAWSVWQYTSSGQVPGIAGLVDRNVATADWWAKVTASTAPAPPPSPQPSGASMLTATANSDGRLEVFRVTMFGTVEHCWQATPGTDSWTAWSPLSPDPIAGRGVAVGHKPDGTLELFAYSDDYSVRHCWQVQGTPSGWSGWVKLGQ